MVTVPESSGIQETIKGSWHTEPTEKMMKGKYDCRKASRLFSVTSKDRIGTSELKVKSKEKKRGNS